MHGTEYPYCFRIFACTPSVLNAVAMLKRFRVIHVGTSNM